MVFTSQVVRKSSASTSGFAKVGTRLCTKTLPSRKFCQPTLPEASSVFTSTDNGGTRNKFYFFPENRYAVFNAISSPTLVSVYFEVVGNCRRDQDGQLTGFPHEAKPLVHDEFSYRVDQRTTLEHEHVG